MAMGRKTSLQEKGSTTTGSSSSSSTGSASHAMTSLERLIRTHPIWFLPALTREDATNLLYGKEEGVSLQLIINWLIPWTCNQREKRRRGGTNYIQLYLLLMKSYYTMQTHWDNSSGLYIIKITKAGNLNEKITPNKN